MVDPLDMKRRQRREVFADRMKHVRKNYSSVATLLERLNSDTNSSYTKEIYSRVVNGHQDAPEPMAKWIVVEFSGGRVQLEFIGVPCFDLLVEALERGGEAHAVISAATDLIEACKLGAMKHHLRSLLPRLFALRAAAHRSLKNRGETVNDYQRAVYFAEQLAPELVPRYRAGELAWRADQMHFRHSSLPKGSKQWAESLQPWEKGLRDIMRELQAIQKFSRTELRLESVRLQTLLRCSSRLGDRDAFMDVLEVARCHSEFGKSADDCDKFLVAWMEEDCDNDFAAAKAGKWLVDLK